jgi:hypothetical protein
LYVNKIIRKMISLESIFFWQKKCLNWLFHFFRVCKKNVWKKSISTWKISTKKQTHER